ncbi:hypothetical protein MHU86_19462 [Fragilaria crotonensis]|nr:hypothetical protein MHU86_19462 [Fragilaria crotonensis]
MPPKSKVQTPFQAKHALEYGVELVKTEKGGVHTVRCLFCVFEGRDSVHVGSMTGRKRKSRQDIKYYMPFSPQNYRSHNSGQHAESWAAYAELSAEDKRNYFAGKVKRGNTLDHHYDLEGDSLVFSVQPPSIDIIVGDMFFRNNELLDDAEEEDEDDVEAVGAATAVANKIAKKAKERTNAMKLFVKDETSDMYVVHIKNVTRYELALDHVGSGMSFRQTATAIEHAKRRTSSAKLAGINDLMVGQFVRSIVAFNLQRISGLMGDHSVWAFSFAGDGSTHRGQSFFDMRVRFCHRGVLANIHLVAIPMFDRHTALIIFDMIVKFLDALYAPWRSKLISVSSDGENTMTGRHSGLVTRLCSAAEHDVLRIWCPPHQIDLVAKRAAERVTNGAWVHFAYTFSVFLRAQNSLITAMNVVKCPKKTNRWVHLGRLLTFYKTYRRKIIAYTEEHRSGTPPTDAWWIVTYAISPAIDKVNATFVVLQNRELLIMQQEHHIQILLAAIINMFGVEPNPAAPFIEEGDHAEVEQEENGYVVVDAFRLQRVLLVAHIEDQGSFPSQCFERLNDEIKNAVLVEIASYAITLIIGLQSVRAERNNANLPRAQDAPPVLPAQLVHFSVTCLGLIAYTSPSSGMRRLSTRLRKITDSCARCTQRMTFSATQSTSTISGRSSMTPGMLPPGRFESLRSFCGGLASAFANTTSVESDFSILTWEMNPNRTCLMHLSLKGHLSDEAACNS